MNETHFNFNRKDIAVADVSKLSIQMSLLHLYHDRGFYISNYLIKSKKKEQPLASCYSDWYNDNLDSIMN